MTKPPFCSLLLAALLGLSQCKNHDPDPGPLSQLPPATQTGANTFGCLLNGQPWLPSFGLPLGAVPPFRVTYDPGYAGGSLVIRGYRIVDGLPNGQNLIIGASSINAVGRYTISDTGAAGASYSTGLRSGPCQEYYNAPSLKMTGQLVITRLDMSKGIISGTFDFTLAQAGCDTLKFTHGRFDKQL